MTIRVYLVLGAMLGAAGVPARAESDAAGVKQRMARAITYDCDTPSGHFSELVLPAPAGSFTVEGRVALREMAAIETYAPLARLTVASAPGAGGGDARSAAGFKLLAMPASALEDGALESGALESGRGEEPRQFVQWDVTENGQSGETGRPIALGNPDAVPFRLHYDGAALAMEVGADSTSIPLKAADPVVRISCSTGEFLFTGLTITP